MFAEFIAGLPDTLSPLSDYPSATNRTAWHSLDAEGRREIEKTAEQFLQFPYPYLTATDFLEFSRTGNRVRYETRLFSKRLALSALVLGECVRYDDRYMDDIINGIYSICDETAWQLPAHNTYIRDTPQLPLPDTTRPVIELFSCETAAILSTTMYLLKEKLDRISPFIALRIRDEIRHRVITPYLTEHFWWMGQGHEPMCNWTIWCTQNILITASYCDLASEEKKAILTQACKSIDHFLKDYGEDGCCEEGAQYYRHAGLCLFQALAILNSITNGYFASLWQNEKIRNIANYILNVHVDGDYYINFADCSPLAGRAGAREFLFGRFTGLEDLSAMAAGDYQRKAVTVDTDEHNLYYRLQELFTRKEMLSYPVPDHIFHPNIYYESVGLMIARDPVWTLGVKAGCNGDSHNHNDTGSIILYKNGQPYLIDIGVESYTKKTFSDRRYEIWTMQSDYHNLPTLNGRMQPDGSKYAATGCNADPASGFITMELAGAYPEDAGIRSYHRTVSLSPDGPELLDRWELEDRQCGSPVILNLITYEKPELFGTERIRIGDLGELLLQPDIPENADGLCAPSAIRIEELPVTDSRLMLCWKHSLYRIRIMFRSLTGSLRLLFV